MKKGLFALALGTFTLGIAEFIIEGIITDIAHNMNVSIPEAGHLISISALGTCARHRWFSCINTDQEYPDVLSFAHHLRSCHRLSITTGSCSAPHYRRSASWRLLRDGYHHWRWRLLPKEGKGTNAVAMMCAGMRWLTCAVVPVGTFLSHMFSWRIPFVSCIVLGLHHLTHDSQMGSRCRSTA